MAWAAIGGAYARFVWQSVTAQRCIWFKTTRHALTPFYLTCAHAPAAQCLAHLTAVWDGNAPYRQRGAVPAERARLSLPLPPLVRCVWEHVGICMLPQGVCGHAHVALRCVWMHVGPCMLPEGVSGCVWAYACCLQVLVCL